MGGRWDPVKEKAWRREYLKRRREHTAYVNFQMSGEEFKLLNKAAERSNQTRSEKIREYITWGLETEGVS